VRAAFRAAGFACDADAVAVQGAGGAREAFLHGVRGANPTARGVP
jgi:hypothetical protein